MRLKCMRNAIIHIAKDMTAPTPNNDRARVLLNVWDTNGIPPENESGWPKNAIQKPIIENINKMRPASKLLYLDFSLMMSIQPAMMNIMPTRNSTHIGSYMEPDSTDTTPNAIRIG